MKKHLLATVAAAALLAAAPAYAQLPPPPAQDDLSDPGAQHLAAIGGGIDDPDVGSHNRLGLPHEQRG